MVKRAESRDHRGWIDEEVLEELLNKPLTFICSVDGSDVSMAGLHYLTEGIMQQKRETYCEVLHVYDDTKKTLPPAWRPDAIRAAVEAKLTSSVSQKRYRLAWTAKDGKSPGQHLCERVQAKKADFSIMGFVGRKGKKDRSLIASNVQTAIQNCLGAVIVLKDESPNVLPVRRVAKFVVSVSLNQASTKAFLDALRLSQPGDEIHVVYVKCFMERTDSDYTIQLREKYAAFFAGLKSGQEGAEKGGEFHFLKKFEDRKTEFVMVMKQRRESTAQAVVRYGDSIEADFMCVGTNTLRAQRGKKPLGSVSLDICMEWDRNFIVSHWVDISPELYEQYGGTSKHLRMPLAP